MRFIFGFHLLFSVIIASLLYFFIDPKTAVSFILGSAVFGINLALIAFSWGHILKKKLVALSISVIVFKFALLVWIIYLVANDNRLSLFWFSIGMGVVIITALATALQTARTDMKNPS